MRFIYKNPETLEKEKIACQQQIVFYKDFIQKYQEDITYYKMFVPALEHLSNISTDEIILYYQNMISKNQNDIQYYNQLISTLEKVLSSF